MSDYKYFEKLYIFKEIKEQLLSIPCPLKYLNGN